MTQTDIPPLAAAPALDQEPMCKVISPAAQRALEEAAARKAAILEAHLASEHHGPKGAEPTRFGDWERNGIAYDF